MERPPTLPRAFASDPKAMEALEHLLAHPEEIADHLVLAGEICQGKEMYGSAAAVLLAIHNRRKWVS